MITNHRINYGAVQGRIALSDEVIARAQALALAYHVDCVAKEWCCDEVFVLALPDWLPRLDSWFPHAQLESMGLVISPVNSSGNELVMSCSTSHTDDMFGPTLLLALHNGGCSFRQGRNRHKTKPGEWFVFDDCKQHEILDAPNSTAYLGWAVPLRHI